MARSKMLYVFSFLLSVQTAVAASLRPIGRRSAAVSPCGAITPAEYFDPANLELSKSFVKRDTTITIETYIHIVHKDNTPEGGNIPQTMLDAQIALLEAGMASLDVVLNIHTPTRYLDATNYYAQIGEVVSHYRVGDYKTLNIVIGGGNGGDSTYARYNSTGFKESDGILIYHGTLPGGAGTYPDYERSWNEGMVMIHEVGHWLSLLHIHEGCGFPYEYDPSTCQFCQNTLVTGDLVTDTPAALMAVNWCEGDPEYYPLDEEDTCPNDPGNDLQDNPMSYAYDHCRGSFFTDGQRNRVHMMWPLTRGKPENW